MDHQKEIDRCQVEIDGAVERMKTDGYAVMGWVDWQAELEIILGSLDSVRDGGTLHTVKHVVIK